MGEVEDLLQFMQLLRGEGGSDPSLALSFLWMEEGSSWVSDLAVGTLMRLLYYLISLFQPLLHYRVLATGSSAQNFAIFFNRNPVPRSSPLIYPKQWGSR